MLYQVVTDPFSCLLSVEIKPLFDMPVIIGIGVRTRTCTRTLAVVLASVREA